MSWMESVTDRWSDRPGGGRLLVRFVGIGFFAYLLVTQGALTGPLWVAVLTVAALLLCYALMFLRLRRPFGRLAVTLTVAMMLCGAVVNPWVAFTGSVFFVLGGVVLIGQPELPVRVGVALVAAVAVVLLWSAALVHSHPAVLLSNALGALAVGLLGLNRRQQVVRRRQELALAARSLELEQRNAELEAQTERTRLETARAAALEERSRIARDIHDVLAHSLGGLVVQLDAVEAELADGRTASAGVRLHASRQLAVDGLREARAAVAELRSDAASEGSVTDPTAAVLAALDGPVGVQLGAELDVVGEVRPVRAATVDALVATVREALTNINKHAPGSRAAATMLFAADEVQIEVVNALPEPGPGPTGSTGTLAGTGSGAGLAGLAQRLTAVDGQFHAGREGGRWVVSARCPEPTGTPS